jgi:hypothetical protein
MIINKEKTSSSQLNAQGNIFPTNIFQCPAFKNYKRQRAETPKKSEFLDNSTLIDSSFACTKLKSPQKIKLTDESWLQNKFDQDFVSGQWITALDKEQLLGNKRCHGNLTIQGRKKSSGA